MLTRDPFAVANCLSSMVTCSIFVPLLYLSVGGILPCGVSIVVHVNDLKLPTDTPRSSLHMQMQNANALEIFMFL